MKTWSQNGRVDHAGKPDGPIRQAPRFELNLNTLTDWFSSASAETAWLLGCLLLFDQIGLTTGRLDEGARTAHSVTAFSPGTWDNNISDFEMISFE